MKVAGCRYSQNIFWRFFQIPRGTTRRSLSLVKLRTWRLDSASFLNSEDELPNETMRFIWDIEKPFEQLFLGKSLFRCRSLFIYILFTTSRVLKKVLHHRDYKSRKNQFFYPFQKILKVSGMRFCMTQKRIL